MFPDSIGRFQKKLRNKKGPLSEAFFCRRLLFMAILAAGRTAFVLVTALAHGVKSIFQFGGSWVHTVTAFTGAGINPFVVAGLAVGYPCLVGGVIEGDGSHFRVELYLRGTFDREGGGRCEGDQK